MANVLKMTMIEALHSLRSAGVSCREIARRLGVHRGTVSWYLAEAPPGSTVAGFGAPNDIRLAMLEAAQRLQIDPDRVSFVDALRWLRCAGQGGSLRPIRVVPERPGRHPCDGAGEPP